ncbi:MAG: threonine--tRNA ligase [Candidatus Kerfeldbacteria bacterium]|nr:threonine--tRNA ligase [Candidatus Kerfeldbacteria bacterium]
MNRSTNRVPIGHIRHSLAHLLAHAVQEQFPGAKFAIGPVIEHGFYYDFLLPRPVTEQDLPALEKRMRALVKKGLPFTKLAPDAPEAKASLTNQPYKRELIDDLKREKAAVTFYTVGDFTDLCRGGHVENTRDIPADAFALDRIAGAYWRGSEKNDMLTRIYGLAFATAPELQDHLAQRKEAEARDHRKLGKELDLFSFDAVAPGAVFWHPNGMIIWNELERLLRDTLIPAGYQEVQTPLMVKPELFNRSGHLRHYKDNMFRVEGKGEEFYLKPMNCPESAVIFATKRHSYRDLPVRLAETGRIHRNELSGTLGGLFRVRQITQDDGHLYCRPDQLEAEITNVLKLSNRIYTLFGLKPSYYLSTKPDDAMGSPALWKQAETALTRALTANALDFAEKPKDGTFYAPKIDIDITDSLGRRWQLCTIQADLVMVPSLPGVEYTDADGKTQHPVVVHRAIFGSFERFIGILVEHYAGAFPTWLAPVQVAILSVGKTHIAHAEKLAEAFRTHGIRVATLTSNETVGYKIRHAVQQKIPYVLVIGNKEIGADTVTVRARGSEEQKTLKAEDFIDAVRAEIEQRR